LLGKRDALVQKLGLVTFEKFVERSRKEFDRTQIKAIADNPEKA